jgi:NAD(P)-dependent dehydrogenase (short-subunit alcohol dehydrogenase family)
LHILIHLQVPAFKRRGGGIFIFNSSYSAFLTADSAKYTPALLLYAVSKHALNHLARMMTSYSKDKIYSYSVCPAVFETQMTQDTAKSGMIRGVGDVNQFALINPFYRGIAGDPKILGDLILSLCDGTTQYKNGDSIVIDGDVTWNGHEFYQILCSSGIPSEVPNQRNLKGELLSKL